MCMSGLEEGVWKRTVVIQQCAGHPSYFNMFGINVSLPAILELEEDQISYLRNSGQYNIKDLSSSQLEQAKPTPLSNIEGDRFESARTFSVNELAFKSPILGTKFANKAKDAIVVPKNSIIARKAENIKKDKARNISILKAASNKANSSNTNKVLHINTKVKDNSISGVSKDKNKPVNPNMLEQPKPNTNTTSTTNTEDKK